MRVRAATALAIVLAATLAGCAGATPTPPSPTPGAVTPSQPGASPATTPSGGSPGEPGTTSGPRATASDPAGTPEATLEPPPDATLVSGGVEQTGVPGGYTWRGGAESAPWLPAAALEGLTVSAGRVAIAVGAPVERWVARITDVEDTTGSRASPLASGEDEITFAAPSSGEWVVAVEVVFASGAGDAAYYWEVAVP